MLDVKFYSQANQDRFVYEILIKSNPNPVLNGTFLDIGCNDPVEISNTYALEQLGWTGCLLDIHEGMIDKCRAKRTSLCLVADATKFDWNTLPYTHFNYLSIDVDQHTEPTIDSLLNSKLSFDIATIEHDCYFFGTTYRDRLREKLTRAGYHLYIGDVCNDDGFYNSFEDWWVSEKYKNINFDQSFINTIHKRQCR